MMSLRNMFYTRLSVSFLVLNDFHVQCYVMILKCVKKTRTWGKVLDG